MLHVLGNTLISHVEQMERSPHTCMNPGMRTITEVMNGGSWLRLKRLKLFFNVGRLDMYIHVGIAMQPVTSIITFCIYHVQFQFIIYCKLYVVLFSLTSKLL